MLFNDKMIILIVSIIVMISAFAFCGCGSSEKYESGGTINKTDYNAPKEIKSDKLVSFSVGFFHEGDYGKEGDRYYTFIVKSDDNGKLMLQDDDTGENRIEVDEAVLNDLQEIIKKYKLVEQNGYNKITAGLPPQFDTCYLEAVYDSGEYISFKENSDPGAEWTGEIRDYFAKVYADHDDDRYLPPKETEKVVQFELTFKDGDKGYFIREHDTYLTLEEFDYLSSEMLLETRTEATSKLYEELSKLVSETNLKEFANEESFPDNVYDDYEIPQYYDFYVKYEYGNVIKGYSDDSETFDNFLQKGTQIIKYIEDYMEKNGETEQ